MFFISVPPYWGLVLSGDAVSMQYNWDDSTKGTHE